MNHQNVAAALAKSDWFASLEPCLQSKVLCEGRASSFNAGQVLFHQGDEPRGLYAILSGEAQVSGLTRDGMEVLVAILRPGEWTGFLACLDDGPYALTVTTSMPSDVFTLPLPVVRRVFFDSAEGMRALMRQQHSATRKVYAFMVEIVARSPLQRLAHRLLDLTWAAHDKTCRSDTIAHVSQDRLAVSIMTSRQCTNRLLGELTDGGVVIVTREKIQVRDWTLLEAIARGELTEVELGRLRGAKRATVEPLAEG